MSHNLPPLNSVRVFEVASRYLNFSRAAEELGVSQGAVSKQIQILEDFVGARLFERLPGRLELTLEGRELKQKVAPAFEILQSSFNRLSRKKSRSSKVKISTVASFASQFIVPHLDRFKSSFPHIELEILTSDRLIDVTREEIDFCVRFGAGPWNGAVNTPLLKGNLVPVCAPGILKIIAAQKRDIPVSPIRQIQVFANNEWDEWRKLTKRDLPVSQSPFIMEHFVVALEAAVSGQGVALLPDIIVDKSIEDGRLVQFDPNKLEWPETFQIVYSSDARPSSNAKQTIQWLQEEIDKNKYKYV